MFNEAEYKLISSYETKGDVNLGIRISIAGNALTEEEEMTVRYAGYDLQDKLTRLRLNRNPSNIALGEQMYGRLTECFPSPIYVKKVDNPYWPGDPNNMSLEVTTPKGIIVVGWRKSVIEIDWTKSDIYQDADELFPQEDVTKDTRMIHAWGYEKATEYIGVLLS